ncbi:MAG: ABC transporter substrate-binding protein [Spirochaetaceae bacterium]|jgi:branched-chain amino acid transport system substrate-binding protein|nr:ABC transporter substrate-binding protein [Spirochaetaceae bacterium]
MQTPTRFKSTLPIFLFLVLFAATGCTGKKPSGEPINVGLIAPLTGPLASSGEAIQRGILLCMDEINSTGGVLGRPLALVTRDVQNDPERGIRALHELVEEENIVAVFGGIFSEVMIAQLDSLQELQIPLIDPWGSMTGITENGQSPNYAFRVSVSDKHADEFLVRYAVEVLNRRRPGIIADTSAWGEANLTGLLFWLDELGMDPAGVARFNQGDRDMTHSIQALKDAGADSLLMVANATEGASIVRSRSLLGWDIPVISHWGISGGDFAEKAGLENIGQVYTLQTFSFFGDIPPKRQGFLLSYHDRFGTRAPEDILSPVGVAHGYDGMLMLSLAIKQAGSTQGMALRNALEQLGEVQGLIKTYNPPFSPSNHDALLAQDYMMTQWDDGHLVPAAQPQLSGAR